MAHLSDPGTRLNVGSHKLSDESKPRSPDTFSPAFGESGSERARAFLPVIHHVSSCHTLHLVVEASAAVSKKRNSVFISSTSTDLQAERIAAVEALNRLSIVPIAMEYFSSDTRLPSEVVSEKLAESDAVLFIVGSRLGSKVQNSKKYFVELEYELALKLKKIIHVLIPHPDRKVRSKYDAKSPNERRSLEKLIARTASAHTVRRWKHSSDISNEVLAVFSNASSFKQRTSSKLPSTGFLNPVRKKQNQIQSSERKIRSTRASEDIPDSIFEMYEENFYQFDDYLKTLLDEVRNIVFNALPQNRPTDFIFEGRPKDPENLKEKWNRPSKAGQYKKLSDITDLCGIRVVTFHQGDAKTIVNALAEQFSEAQISEKKPAQQQIFGYRATHILIPTRIKISGQGKFFAEIQIRTFLQHTWAQIEHQLGYKALKSDETNQRLFAQIAALLEIADGKFFEAKNRQLIQFDIGRSIESPRTSKAPLIESVAKSTLELSAPAIFGFFVSDAWKNTSVFQRFSRQAYVLTGIDSSRSTSEEVEAVCEALLRSQIVSIGQLRYFIEIDGDRIVEFAAGLYKIRKYGQLSVLDVLWFIVLICTADNNIVSRTSREAVLAVMKEHHKFPDEDRDRIAALTF
jgi:ppGpp synthetase/RelA/SpoT-type nucleotidyltranferase